MRTTLKRGIGRGAAFNGRTAMPSPASRSPAPLRRRVRRPRCRRYVQPPPERGRGGTVRLVLGYFLLAVVTIVGGVIGGVYLWRTRRSRT